MSTDKVIIMNNDDDGNRDIFIDFANSLILKEYCSIQCITKSIAVCFL